MRSVSLVLLWSALAGAQDPVLADEVIATVDGRSLLLSELVLDARLRLVAASGDHALTGTLAPEDLAVALESLIDDVVVYAEADRLQVFDVGPTEIQDALADLHWAAGDAWGRFLAKHEIDEQTVKDVLRRRLRAARYLDGRFRVAARTRDADVMAWVAAHPDDGTPAQVRQMLSAEKFRHLSETFVVGIRKRAQVAMLRDFRGANLDTASSGVAGAPERLPRKRAAAP